MHAEFDTVATWTAEIVSDLAPGGPNLVSLSRNTVQGSLGELGTHSVFTGDPVSGAPIPVPVPAGAWMGLGTLGACVSAGLLRRRRIA